MSALFAVVNVASDIVPWVKPAEMVVYADSVEIIEPYEEVPDAGQQCDSELTTIQKIQRQLQQRTENNVLEGACPCRGNVKMLVINIIASTSSNELTGEEVSELFFGDHYSYGKRDDNLTDYFESVSYGKFSVYGEVVDYTTDHDFSSGLPDLEEIITDVLDDVDVSEYDSNNDGYIDAISLLLPDIWNISLAYVSNCDLIYENYSLASYIVLTKKI